MNGTHQGRSLHQAIGNEIKRRRIRIGLAVAELADKIGITAIELTAIENGEMPVTVDTLFPISKVLNIKAGELFPKT